MGNKFKRVLVANRGEIAIRVMRSLRELGIESIAVYSEADEYAPHVRYADHAILIGEAPALKSYLRIDVIINAAKEMSADAIHPGYGFLAERAELASECAAAGIAFVGPSAKHISLMGDKIAARQAMASVGMPIVPGVFEPITSNEDAVTIAAEIGFPVAFKASAGGGGRGMRIAYTPEEVIPAFEGAQGEGERFFGNSTCYAERFLIDPRHIEVQILADKFGKVLHLGERDCSVQRRNQKLLEETPAPTLSDEARKSLHDAATKAVATIGYESAGTMECLAVGDEFFFLEMNTRIQVEHCVSEMVTGIDVVAEQIRIAEGDPLPMDQEDIKFIGHSIECRINAESAARGFLPSPGTITSYKEPGGLGVRVDSAAEANIKITPFYDSMFAKLIVHAPDRATATKRMRRALSEYEVTGVRTLIPFHRKLLATEQWETAQTCRDLVEDRKWLKTIEE